MADDVRDTSTAQTFVSINQISSQIISHDDLNGTGGFQDDSKIPVQHIKSEDAKPSKEKSKRCNKCKIQYANPQWFAEHLSPNPVIKSVLQCTVCKSIFANECSVTIHMNKSECGEKHKCQCCNETFNSMYELSKHKELSRHKKNAKLPIPPRKKQKDPGGTCPNCKKKFTSRTSVYQHLKTCPMSGNEGIECPNCKKRYTSKLGLRLHLKKSCPKADGITVEKVQCPKCNKTLAHKASLNAHLKRCGKPKSQPAEIKCPKCEQSLSSSNSLFYHLQTCNGEKRIIKRIVNCPHCDKLLASSKRLYYHLQRCKQNPKRIITHVPCPKCQKIFTCRKDLLPHLQRCKMNNDRITEESTCPMCEKKFAHKKDLKRHVKQWCRRTQTAKTSIVVKRKAVESDVNPNTKELGPENDNSAKNQTLELPNQNRIPEKRNENICQLQNRENMETTFYDQSNTFSKTLVIKLTKCQQVLCEPCKKTFSNVSELNFHQQQCNKSANERKGEFCAEKIRLGRDDTMFEDSVLPTINNETMILKNNFITPSNTLTNKMIQPPVQLLTTSRSILPADGDLALLLKDEQNFLKQKVIIERKQKKTIMCDNCGLTFTQYASLRTHVVANVCRVWYCDQCNLPFPTADFMKSHKAKVCKNSTPVQHIASSEEKTSSLNASYKLQSDLPSFSGTLNENISDTDTPQENNEQISVITLPKHRFDAPDEDYETKFSKSNNDTTCIEPNLQKGENQKDHQCSDNCVNMTETNNTCKHCEKTFLSNAGLLRHMRSYEDREQVCPVCKNKFGSISGLKHHMESTHFNPKHVKRCDNCNNEFTSESLNQHKRTEHPESRILECNYKCCLCETYYFKIKNMYCHYKNIHNIEISLKSSDISKYINPHKKNLKLKNMICDPKYGCIHCGEQYSTENDYVKHVQKNCKNINILFICPYCPTYWSDTYKYLAHLHRCKPLPCPVLNVSCPICVFPIDTESFWKHFNEEISQSETCTKYLTEDIQECEVCFQPLLSDYFKLRHECSGIHHATNPSNGSKARKRRQKKRPMVLYSSDSDSGNEEQELEESDDVLEHIVEYNCLVCDFNDSSKNVVLDHYTSCHTFTSVEDVPCTIESLDKLTCAPSTFSVAPLNISTDKILYGCVFCDAMFESHSLSYWHCTNMFDENCIYVSK